MDMNEIQFISDSSDDTDTCSEDETMQEELVPSFAPVPLTPNAVAALPWGHLKSLQQSMYHIDLHRGTYIFGRSDDVVGTICLEPMPRAYKNLESKRIFFFRNKCT